MAAEDLYEVSWGSVRLFCAEIDSDNSRTLVIHDLAAGDDHPTSDRGAGQRPVRCSLLFDEFPGETTTALDRLLLFKRQVDEQTDASDGLLFVHPIDGPYFAKVGEFTYRIDDSSNVVDATCTFYRVGQIVAALSPGLATVPSVGLDAVAARADELNALLEDSVRPSELAAVGLPTDFVTTAAALPTAWLEDGDIPTRDILADVARVTDQLNVLTSILEDDLALFEAWQGTMLFGAAFRAAAVAATSETPSVFTMRIGTPCSVLALVTRVYGGADSEDRERQVRGLNDIRTPGGLLEVGTELVMPALKRAA